MENGTKKEINDLILQAVLDLDRFGVTKARKKAILLALIDKVVQVAWQKPIFTTAELYERQNLGK